MKTLSTGFILTPFSDIMSISSMCGSLSILTAPSSTKASSLSIISAPKPHPYIGGGYCSGGFSLVKIECSSRPKKKATSHHMKTRPRKTQAWDIKRKPTVYPPLPPLPPDWTLLSSAAAGGGGGGDGSDVTSDVANEASVPSPGVLQAPSTSG